MTISVLTIIQKVIDICLVWLLIYFVLKNIKNNIKMTLLFKGVLIVIVVKLLSDWLNLTTIGYSAFSYCDSMSIIFFNSKDAQYLDDNAFYTSVGSGKLETIIFGKNVESISTTSFGQSTINTIISLNSTPPTCVDNAFKEIDKTNPLYVPKGCYSTYWSSPIWSEFMNIIEIEKIIESISKSL